MGEKKKFMRVSIHAEFGPDDFDDGWKLRNAMIDFLIDHKSMMENSIKYGDGLSFESKHPRYPEEVCFMCEGPEGNQSDSTQQNNHTIESNNE